MKKAITAIVIVVLIAAGVWFAATFFEVDTRGDFELPDIDVDAEGGNIPEMEVRAPEVEIGSEEVDVTVPDIDVNTEEKRFNIPTVDIEKPGEQSGNVE